MEWLCLQRPPPQATWPRRHCCTPLSYHPRSRSSHSNCQRCASAPGSGSRASSPTMRLTRLPQLITVGEAQLTPRFALPDLNERSSAARSCASEVGRGLLPHSSFHSEGDPVVHELRCCAPPSQTNLNTPSQMENGAGDLPLALLRD